MKSSALLVLFALWLSACSHTPAPAIAEASRLGPTLPGAILYACSGGDAAIEHIEALYDSDDKSATVVFAGKTYVLPLTPSGSGARYSNGSITWWTKGQEALWQMDENFVLRDCRQDL